MWGRAGNQDNENIQKNKKNRKAAEDLKLIAMERLAESKARKWASLIDNDESPKNSKKQEFWVWYTSIFTWKSRKWQRIKETGAWT